MTTESNRTVNIPTHVSNEQAEWGQQKWNEYWKQVEEAERTAMKATGGGCIWGMLSALCVTLLFVVVVVMI